MKNNTNKRVFYGAVGCLILLFSGVIYAWSVLSGPIAEEFSSWSRAQLSFTFTLVMSSFCLGRLACGFTSQRFQPSFFVRLSAVSFLIGFLLASQAKTPVGLYIGFGVLCGFASGFSYNSVLSTVNAWFPDKPGFISGVLLMGFGFSSFLVGKIYQAFTPAILGGWRISFIVLGCVTAAVLLICSFTFPMPNETQPIPTNFVKAAPKIDSPPSSTLKSLSFWLFFFWAAGLGAVGQVIVSQASGITQEVGASIAPPIIATVVGLISIFNGVGRVLHGCFYDRFGQHWSILLITGLFLITDIVLIGAIILNSFSLVVFSFVLAGLSYGGLPPLSSTFIRHHFGVKYFSINFAFMSMSIVLSSFGSTIAGMLFDRTGSYLVCMFMIFFLISASFLMFFGITATERRKNTINKTSFLML